MKVLLAFTVAAIALGLSAARMADTAQACGIAGPFDFDTWEAEDYITVYGLGIDLVTSGMAVPSTYTVGEAGEVVDLRYQGLEAGSRSARLPVSTARVIPPTLYQSMVYIESDYTQAAGSVPFGGVGPTLRSFDCGYGLGQITTGMSNGSGTAAARQAAIGTHYLFNMAEGVRIFADKWNSAPQLRPIAGDGNPAVLEDWYYAIWSYNGFAFSNHPLNPMRNPLRGGAYVPEPGDPTPTPTASPSPEPTPDNPIVEAGAASPIYHCFDRAAPSYQAQGNGQPLFGYGDYTYPERVYGCVRYPPKRAPIGSPAGTPATIQFWHAIPVSMPNFRRPQVAQALQPQHFITCENQGFSTGCPAMDFPTAFEGAVTTHTDPTPLPGAALRDAALGAPNVTVSGPSSVVLTATPFGVDSAAFTVSNSGTGVGPFRVRATADWLVVRHPGDAASRTLDGGVAVGSEIQVVTQSPPNRSAQAGYASSLIVTADTTKFDAADNRDATLWIEPILGGAPVAITVRLEGDVGPITPRPPLPYRQILPWVSSEPTN